MSLYTEIRDGVMTWTNKPLMVAETDLAIKQALRTAHKAGTFYRDLVTVNLTGQAQDTVQQIDLPTQCPGFRQMAYVKPTGRELHYSFIDITDLFDQDKFYRYDVYYGVGANLVIRAAEPAAELELCYYKYPTTSPIENIDSWIAQDHQDLIILWAAATVLTFAGEQEIKTRVEALAKLAFADLIEDATTLLRR